MPLILMADGSKPSCALVFCEFLDRYSLTIARWFPTLLAQRTKTGNHTTPRDAGISSYTEIHQYTDF